MWEALESAFGGRPKARDSYKYTEGALVSSVRSIASHAAEHLPGSQRNAATALRQIAGMADGSIGKRLAEAKRTHERDRAALRPLLEAIGTGNGL